MQSRGQLARHTFVRRVMEEMRPQLLQDLDNMPKDRTKLPAWREANRQGQTPAGRYLHRVGGRVFNLLRVLELLERSRYLLFRSPPVSRSRSVSLTRDEWAQYHFFVFTASLPAIVDCSLLLASETYQLGIPARLCSFDLLTSHDYVARSPVVKALKSLRSGLQGHIQRRHRYLHRGEEPDVGELTDPEWLMDLKQITFLQGTGDVSIDRKLLSRAWQDTLREIRPSLDAAEQCAYSGTDGVLTSLLPQLATRLALFGPVQRGGGAVQQGVDAVEA